MGKGEKKVAGDSTYFKKFAGSSHRYWATVLFYKLVPYSAGKMLLKQITTGHWSLELWSAIIICTMFIENSKQFQQQSAHLKNNLQTYKYDLIP